MFAQFDVIVFIRRFSKMPEYIEKTRGGNRKKQQTVGNITLNNGAFRCLRVNRLLSPQVFALTRLF